MSIGVAIKKPNEIPNLYGWWDMADSNNVVDGTGLTSLLDKSGNAFDFNLRSGSPSLKQTGANGNAVLRGNGIYDSTITLNGASPFTTFILFKNIGNTFSILGSSGDATGFGLINISSEIKVYQGSGSVGIPSDSNYHQFSWVTSNTSSQRIVRIDGSNKTPLANNIGSISFLTLNNRGVFPSNGNNEFAEIIIFNHVLSIQEIRQIERYLQFKWGVL